MAEPSVTPSSFAALRRLRAGSGRTRFRSRSQGTVTAIDTDGRTVWVAQAATRGDHSAIALVDAAALEIPKDADITDPAVLGVAIGKALKQLNLKPGAVIMGVPRTKLVLRPLTVPTIEDVRELASVVHLQVAKDLPFRNEDAVIDFTVRDDSVGQHPTMEPGAVVAEGVATVSPSKMEVLVAVVQRDVVSFCERVAEAAGVKLAALGLRASANARCVEASRMAQGGETVAFVSLGFCEVHIDVIGRDALLFSRGTTVKSDVENRSSETGIGAAPLSKESRPLTVPQEPQGSTTVGAVDSDSFVDHVCIEVVRSLHSYAGLFPNSPVARILVSGAGDREETVALALSRRFHVPCDVFDASTLPELPAGSVRHARGAVGAIGLALGGADASGLPFNFLDPKKPAVERNLVRRRVIIGVAVAAALLMILVVVRVKMVNQRMAVFRGVQLELAEAEKKRPIYLKMRRQAATVNEWLKGERDWLEHYAYLSAVLPPCEDLFVSSLTISGQGAIRLSVQARSGEILSKLDKQLRAAGYEVKPLAITPGNDRFGYDFRSTVELIVPDKMKFDIATVRASARPPDDSSLEPGALKGGRP